MGTLEGSTPASTYTQLLQVNPSPGGNRNVEDGAGNVQPLHLDRANGRLGVMNASPSVALDVTGSQRLSGTLTVGGDVALSRAAANVLELAAGDSLRIVDNGSVSVPALAVGAADDGFYQPVDNQIALALSGAQVAVIGENFGSFAEALRISATSTNNAVLEASGASGGSGAAYLNLSIAGSFAYQLSYQAANTRFALTTTDSDGGGTNADLFRIPDGQLTVDGNTTFDDNAFDYVCEACGKHAAEEFRCCGPVEWHDDAALMDALVRRPAGVLAHPAVERMERLGLVNTYGGEGLFVSMNRMPWFLMSAIAQLHRRLEAAGV